MLNNKNTKVRIEIINQLELYEPTLNSEHTEFSVPITDTPNSCYRKSKYSNFVVSSFNHFPILVNPDGSPWTEANRYLLSKLTGVILANHRTLESIASDLKNFRQWLLNEEVDFLYITERPRSRPTYSYCAYLHDELRLKKIKAKTAKRRMSAVQSFYRWLINDGFEFKYPLWLENDGALSFKDSRGFKRSKTFMSTDLVRSIKVPHNTDDYSEYIEDGGRLRPLPKEEQVALVESLKKVGNVEMLLSFLFALTTGGRLQSVFTLRHTHFSKSLSDDVSQYRLKIGNGTLIDTKYGKQMVIHVPVWLYKRIQIYLNSERYKKRLLSCPNQYKNEGEQYVFLTRAGLPYYMASQDEFTSLYRSPPRGNAITQFIRQQLKPNLIDNANHFDIRFHDLRATFGMNLLEGKLQGYKLGGVAISDQPDFYQILMYVRERMGHSRLKTTEGYLNYRQKYHLAMHVQTEYENFLREIVREIGDLNEME